METVKVLKALADETRFKILKLLLEHNFCVRALSRKLDLTESAVSQHLKVLREAGLLVGEKKGYYMHYDVDKNALRALASKIEELALDKREACTLEKAKCKSSEQERCHVRKSSDESSNEVHSCHAKDGEPGKRGSIKKHGNCNCHKA